MVTPIDAAVGAVLRPRIDHLRVARMDGEGAHLDVGGQAVGEMLPAVVVARPPEEPASIWCLCSNRPVRRAGVDPHRHADLLKPSAPSQPRTPRARTESITTLARTPG